jgi:hypothetical protein
MAHPHEDVPHYHLYVQFPSGKTKELYAQFALSLKHKNVTAAKVGDIKRLVEDEIGTKKPFTLFWKGKKLDDEDVKLRKIVVNKTKLPLYHPNSKDPIVILYHEDIGDPLYYEAHDKDWTDADTPPSGSARGIKKTMKKKHNKKRKTKRRTANIRKTNRRKRT